MTTTDLAPRRPVTVERRARRSRARLAPLRGERSVRARAPVAARVRGLARRLQGRGPQGLTRRGGRHGRRRAHDHADLPRRLGVVARGAHRRCRVGAAQRAADRGRAAGVRRRGRASAHRVLEPHRPDAPEPQAHRRADVPRRRALAVPGVGRERDGRVGPVRALAGEGRDRGGLVLRRSQRRVQLLARRRRRPRGHDRAAVEHRGRRRQRLHVPPGRGGG